MDYIGLDHHVFVDKFGRKIVVRVDTPYLCSSKDHGAWTLCLHKVANGCLVGEIELGMGTDDRLNAAHLKRAHNCRSDHAAIACNKYPALHALSSPAAGEARSRARAGAHAGA